MPTTLYVVMSGDDERQEVVGIYTDPKKANKIRDEFEKERSWCSPYVVGKELDKDDFQC